MRNQAEVGTIREKFIFSTRFLPTHQDLLVTIKGENG